MTDVDLAAVIGQLREELDLAVRSADGQRVRFELGPIELTMTVAVAREAAPGAKLRFWVVEAGTDSKFSRESTQQLRLTLTPQDTAPTSQAGTPVALRVGGESVAGEK